MILYRLILALIAPWIVLRLGARVLRGVEGRGDFAQRLGRLAAPGGAGPVVWLHGASNGELASVAALVAASRAARPDLRLVVSANTLSGRALAAGWPGVTAVLAPLDLRAVVRRFLAALNPDLVIVVENELWPNRLHELAARGVPVAVVGARMSARSFARWQRLDRVSGGLVARLLGGLALVSPQDAASATRFAALGAARLGEIVDLKAGLAVGPGPAADWPAARAQTVLAASTHPGEEALIVQAALTARGRSPGLTLILAPRHPRRADAIVAELAAMGVTPPRRSLGQPPGEAPVYLADTLGEMGRWYAAAGITVIGGSFADHGGHTPHEPAAHGSAVLHGPHMSNFEAARAALALTGAAVADGGDLALRLAGMAGDGAGQAAMAAAQGAALAALRADPSVLAAQLRALLPQDYSTDT